MNRQSTKLTDGVKRIHTLLHDYKSRCLSSSSSTLSKARHQQIHQIEDAFKDGTVEGVWLFHRHGDRTPARPLIADHMIEAEASFWKTKIPPLDRSMYEALSLRFPARIHAGNNDGKFLDTGKGREPYGYLTYKGMQQMFSLGRTFAYRYNNNSQHTSDHTHPEPEQFLTDWDIHAYSTNYLRTVMSAQCFLDGLLQNSNSTPHNLPQNNSFESYYNININQHIPNTNSHNYQNTPLEEYISKSNSTMFTNNPIHINIRDRSNDTLNAFDKDPSLMQSLVKDVVTTHNFETIDARASPLAARLANFLPGLAKASSYGGPSGINWIHATDHFVCRSSHDMQYVQFSIHENNPHAEQMLASMSHPTVAHLAWRFRQWYQSPPLLAAIAAPPLREIETQITNYVSKQLNTHDFTNTTDNASRKPFVIYSCHDVTLLSLLYGISADFVSSSDDLKAVGIESYEFQQRWRWWPKYASSLVFELVKKKEVDSSHMQQENGKNDNDDDDDSSSMYGLRILLNGKPIRVLPLLRASMNDRQISLNSKESRKKDNIPLLNVSQFTKMIDDLELKGNGYLGSVGNKDVDDKSESDMSTWTG